MLSIIKVSNLMTKDVVTSNPKDTLSKVIGKLSNKSLHEIPVVDDKNLLLGYFDFDILSKKRHAPINTKIERLMVAPPKVGEDEGIFEAAKVMLETGFRAVPVVDKNNFLRGVISRTDIIRAVPRLKDVKNKRAEELMTPEPQVLQMNDDVEKALSLMIALGEPAAPVVDRNGKVAGSVLIEGIGRSMWYEEDGRYVGDVTGENSKPKIEVQSFVSEAAVVKKEDSIRKLAEEMSKTNPYLSIVEDGFHRPLGVITQYDILKELVEYTTERGVYVDICGLDINDPFVYSGMISKIERFVEKTNKFSWIIPQNLNIHVETYDKGGRKKWSLRARFMTDKGLFYVKTIGWDMLRCVDEVIDELNKKIMTQKKR